VCHQCVALPPRPAASFAVKVIKKNGLTPSDQAALRREVRGHAVEVAERRLVLLLLLASLFFVVVVVVVAFFSFR